MRSLLPPPVVDLPSLDGLHVLVMGLGRFGGGVAVTRWLAAQGARVALTDSADPNTLTESLAAISDLDIEIHLGIHRLAVLNGIDLVVVNPAVRKRTSEFFREIARRRIKWTTEINLFCERCPAGIIGVTGTFGKSTTCGMLEECLKRARTLKGEPPGVYLGGNIGRSLLPVLSEIQRDDVVVLELSNAQLEDLPEIDRVPELAVITNLHAHHFDRYDSVDAYIDAKLNLVRGRRGAPPLVIGEVAPEARACLVEVVRERGVCLIHASPPEPPLELRIPGRHNQATAGLVLAVCNHLGLDVSVCHEALVAFPGLPHRLEPIRSITGVAYVNDSKSTSPNTTLAAVQSFDKPVVAIVGGQGSGAPDEAWAHGIAAACKRVICIGDTAPVLADVLRRATPSPSAGCVVHEVTELEDAVRLARTQAASGDVVLFSPGAPSFDRYANFEERGRHFSSCVARL